MWVQTWYSQPRPMASHYACRSTLYQSTSPQGSSLQLGPTSTEVVVFPSSPESMLLEAHPSRRLILPAATCRSISAKLISIRAMNLCQKPTGTKLILNTRWMVLAIGCRMLWVSSPGLDGRR